ncbi:DNA-directed RNA polymerase, omega subunit [Campylobacter blaseri]|uniref:DNA-directed RNA polymerase subunit omega n=1 Tax=Campylobacter blaseri TaxID=2042961 RepID=A0A2P8R024_9BACT|nr:DNA-directed RNA polymerase subunit omega [Campylobacter blaseri]PSM51847.1 DNA-directed RNA polymerase subunit omega [Campylobacter blaseri]PSM53638.1 DNA-directed RNA polymerase subunit omega [Campylobacter blaseri]QKF86453.1 DNA-directed RNA polymerase, omega subunit [Campylobacter blaseri]
MKRPEEIMAKALKTVGGDRYKLSLMVAKRANQLHAGTEPLIKDYDLRNMKLTDIALLEIAEGKVVLDGFTQKD